MITIMEVVVGLLVIVMIVLAIYAAETKDLMYATAAAMGISLVVSLLFYILQAPDVAMAEAAIGSGLSTAVFVIAIKKTERYEHD
jgi:energy-converting hydrogenase B subunit D